MNEKLQTETGGESAPFSTPSETRFIRLKSKVHRKKFAPNGFLFFIVKIEVKGRVYSNTARVYCRGLTQKEEDAIFRNMEESIIKKFKRKL